MPLKEKRIVEHLRAYWAWKNAVARCTKESDPAWRNYGGRGIKVSEAWKASFWQFLEDVGDCPPGMQIERIDNNGHYEAGNVKWVTRLEQAQNKRNRRLGTINGVTKYLRDWANEYGIIYETPQIQPSIELSDCFSADHPS
jgi:hypothetical protein